ncbi:hypothetical protein [Streptomyces xanthophaeus]|uniref:hypothetical protein n=1 Tax=Streptomyces xanthophaeus TaxID=67385 RepID=UPI002649A150|nr:hypothetical protein [Streptomyces xanthophaeus]WKD36522.1 hypothetical protein KO717_34375 [Streptomyces xanthophaeus]
MRFRTKTSAAPRTRGPRPPAILYGAAALAGLSLIWSGYAITDLMHSGWFGLSVAIAGDIGWITVLWAEYRGITVQIKDKDYSAAPAGWAIALGVAALLALHGHDVGSTGQMYAGPFVVLVGKIVWTFALASLRDPAALTPEQEAEIASVIRDSEYEARLHAAQLGQLDRAADAAIARIRAEARITRARDQTDAEIVLERIEQRRAIERNTPIAITASSSEPPTEPLASPSIPLASESIAPHGAPALTRAIADREQPSIADLARDQVAITPDNPTAVRAVLALRPDAHEPSVAAAVRKARSKMTGGYN